MKTDSQYSNPIRSRHRATSQLRSHIILNDNGLPKTYFDLIQKAGSAGPYQRNIFIVFVFIWFISGVLSLGTSFLFMNYSFQCKANGLLTDNCEKAVCELDSSRWKDYLAEPKVKSIATQFGPFYCSDSISLTMIQSSVYAGIFFGLIIFLYITDNYGRKVSAILAWGVSCLGLVILSASFNIPMVVIGSFLSGAGSEASMRISLSFINEVTENYLRQKYSILVSVGYGFAGVFVGVIYWLLMDWRIIMIAFIAVPGVIVQIMFVIYVEETPKYLIRKGVAPTVKALNRIARINHKGDGPIPQITEADVRNVMEEEVQESEFNQIITPFDVFRFPSLRLKSICLCIIFFLINYLYLGPILGISSLGVDPFVSQIMLSVAELLTYPFSFHYIQKLPRRNIGILFFGISAFLTTILIFVEKPADCDMCFQGIFELVLASGSRLCIAFYYSILLLYVPELYPERARGQGFGVCSSLNAVAAMTGSMILNTLQANGISTYIFFTFCAIIAAFNVILLKETRGEPLMVEIEEIAKEKEKVKTFRIKERTEFKFGGSSTARKIQ